MKGRMCALLWAFMLFLPIAAQGAGVGSLTPGDWEERHMRILSNAFGLPLADSFRPLCGRHAGELIAELERREDFDRIVSDPYVKAVYDRLARRFQYELRIARQKNETLDIAPRILDAATLNIGGRDRSGPFDTPFREDPEHPSALFGSIRLDHGLAIEDWFALDIAESAEGQWMPQNDEKKSDGRVFVDKLRATGVVANVMTWAGRDRIAWGYGKRGDLILSDNAGPYDAVELGSFRPFSLPWVFSYAGRWHIRGFAAQIRGNRNDYDHPYLFGARLNWAPWPWIEGSLARTMMALGEGRPAMDGQDWMNAVFGKREHTYGSASDTNGLFEVDVRLHLGFLKQWVDMGSLSIFYEFGSESFTRDYSKAYVSGDMIGLEYDDTRWGLWAEWAETMHDKVAWYSHYVYTDGYTQEGKIIGHPAGAFGRDYALGAWFFAAPQIELNLEGALTTHEGKQGLPDNLRAGGRLGGSIWLPKGFQLTLQGGYQQTSVESADELTDDFFGRAALEWQYVK